MRRESPPARRSYPSIPLHRARVLGSLEREEGAKENHHGTCRPGEYRAVPDRCCRRIRTDAFRDHPFFPTRDRRPARRFSLLRGSEPPGAPRARAPIARDTGAPPREARLERAGDGSSRAARAVSGPGEPGQSLLLNYHVFDACARRMRQHEEIAEGTLTALRLKMGFRITQPEEVPASSVELPEGESLLLLSPAGQRVRATIRAQAPAALLASFEREGPPLVKGMPLTVYFHNRAGIFSFPSRITDLDGNALHLEHSSRVTHHQRRKYYRRKGVPSRSRDGCLNRGPAQGIDAPGPRRRRGEPAESSRAIQERGSAGAFIFAPGRPRAAQSHGSRHAGLEEWRGHGRQIRFPVGDAAEPDHELSFPGAGKGGSSPCSR